MMLFNWVLLSPIWWLGFCLCTHLIPFCSRPSLFSLKYQAFCHWEIFPSLNFPLYFHSLTSFSWDLVPLWAIPREFNDDEFESGTFGLAIVCCVMEWWASTTACLLSITSWVIASVLGLPLYQEISLSDSPLQMALGLSPEYVTMFVPALHLFLPVSLPGPLLPMSRGSLSSGT